MAVTIKLRRGTASEWTSANPVLEQGEVGIELDTNKIKIGDGSSNWSSLDYANDLLPDQTGNSGKFLSTDGTVVSWQSVDALPSQTGNSGKYLTTDGTNASWATVSSGAAVDDASLAFSSQVFS